MYATSVTPYDDVQWTKFTARDSAGNEYRWRFGRSKKSSLWYLKDPDGYIRSLESSWVDSVPRIQMVISNHGQTSEVN